MQVVAKFFALYRQIAGTDKLTVELPDGSTVARLIDLLNEKFEKFDLDVQRTVVIINKKKASATTILNNGDEAFILQLMSGG